jgi:hypothetical protein
LLFVATGALGDPFPEYKVEPDTVLERVYTSRTTLESTPAQLFYDGKEVPAEGHPQVSLRVADTRSLTVKDTIRAVADGRPTKFTRSYDELENSATETVVAKPPDGQEDLKASTRERTSPLSGKTVRFTWDDAEEEYTPAVDGKGVSDEALEELAADAEWLPLLADRTREKGVAFALDPKLFQRVQTPLGNITWQVDGQDPEPASKSLNDELAESLDGKAKATWQGSREVDGRTCSVFALEAELTMKGEAEFASSGETRSVVSEAEYTGEILWDLAAGHVASYTFEADVHTVLTNTRQVDSPNGSVELRRVFDLTGTSKHALTVN